MNDAAALDPPLQSEQNYKHLFVNKLKNMYLGSFKNQNIKCFQNIFQISKKKKKQKQKNLIRFHSPTFTCTRLHLSTYFYNRLHSSSDWSTLVYIRRHSPTFVYTHRVTLLHSSRHVDTYVIKNRQGSKVKLHRFMTKFHKTISFRIISKIIEPQR